MVCGQQAPAVSADVASSLYIRAFQLYELASKHVEAIRAAGSKDDAIWNYSYRLHFSILVLQNLNRLAFVLRPTTYQQYFPALLDALDAFLETDVRVVDACSHMALPAAATA